MNTPKVPNMVTPEAEAVVTPEADVAVTPDADTADVVVTPDADAADAVVTPEADAPGADAADVAVTPNADAADVVVTPRADTADAVVTPEADAADAVVTPDADAADVVDVADAAYVADAADGADVAGTPEADTPKAPAAGALTESAMDIAHIIKRNWWTVGAPETLYIDMGLPACDELEIRTGSQTKILRIRGESMQRSVLTIQDTVAKILENQHAIVEEIRNPNCLVWDDPVSGTRLIGPMWERIQTTQKAAMETFDQVIGGLTILQNGVAAVAETRAQVVKDTSIHCSKVTRHLVYVCRTLYTLRITILDDQVRSMKIMDMIRRDVASILENQVQVLDDIKWCDVILADDLTRGTVQFSAAWDAIHLFQASTVALYKSVLSDAIPTLQRYVDMLLEVQKNARRTFDLIYRI